jgi:adenylate kinase
MALHRHDEVVLLFGAPGAGKGTQARYLAEVLRVPHVASGDLLRENRQRGTRLGRAAQAFMDRGDLVPDDLVVDMIVERLDGADAAHGALLDGFPRTLAQSRTLEGQLAERGGRVCGAIYIDVPTNVLIERLAGRWLCRTCQASYHELFHAPAEARVCDACEGELYQRADDKREVVANRIKVYLRDTLPVVNCYEQRGLLLRVDGDRPIAAVRAALRDVLGIEPVLSS